MLHAQIRADFCFYSSGSIQPEEPLHATHGARGGFANHMAGQTVSASLYSSCMPGDNCQGGSSMSLHGSRARITSSSGRKWVGSINLPWTQSGLIWSTAADCWHPNPRAGQIQASVSIWPFLPVLAVLRDPSDESFSRRWKFHMGIFISTAFSLKNKIKKLKKKEKSALSTCSAFVKKKKQNWITKLIKLLKKYNLKWF